MAAINAPSGAGGGASTATRTCRPPRTPRTQFASELTEEEDIDNQRGDAAEGDQGPQTGNLCPWRRIFPGSKAQVLKVVTSPKGWYRTAQLVFVAAYPEQVPAAGPRGGRAVPRRGGAGSRPSSTSRGCGVSDYRVPAALGAGGGIVQPGQHP